jgi:hypothetical protein
LIDKHKDSTLEERQAEAWVRNTFDAGETKPAKEPSVCHPDKPRYGNGPFCRSCVDRIRWQGERGKEKLRAHVDANQSLSAAMRADALEKIGSIREYVRKPEEERQQINTRKPSVRQHVAKTAILSNLDFQKTAAELQPDATAYEQHQLAHKLEHDAQVKQEIEAQLTLRGLSDQDRDYFVKRLWQLFESSDPRMEAKSLSAMRILGKAFVSEKIENTQVEVLKISGLDDGIARMTGGDPDAQTGESSFSAAGVKAASLEFEE